MTRAPRLASEPAWHRPRALSGERGAARPPTRSRAGVALTPRTTLQDETQRQEAVAGQAPQPVPRPAPPPASPAATDPRLAPQVPRPGPEPVRVEGPVTPRGLEGLRQE